MALSFQKKLMLNQWVLGLLECASLESLAEGLKREGMEGYDENNRSRFCNDLINMAERKELSNDALKEYDENIYRHTVQLNKSRRGADEKIRWKYFQYLALLFAEIYLDRYFRDAEGMLGALNTHVSAFNEGKSDADCIDDFAPADLRRIAFFQATGSGKTLLMHINIMQYKHYLKLAGRENELNRIILLTPNDGLSRQHLAEFDKSSMPSKMFEKNSSGGFFTDQFIEVIDIHKLGDKMGDKTVDVAAFEGNNLVLVDEGHRGSSGEEWMKRRNHLSKDGFSFEYSATFEQAISASRDKALEQQYAKAILFNYSYKYFYADGFGKDYKILNLDDSTDDDRSKRRRYLIACMLSFYQQMRLFQTDPNMAKKYNLEKPLLVLVGARVTKGFNSKEASDVIEFLRFLAGFVKSKKETIDEIAAILAGKHDLMAGDKNVFYGAFDSVRELGAPAIFADIKRRVFNSEDGVFVIERLTGSGGEIALQLGEGKPFGVINVGDSKKLTDLCRDDDDLFEVRERAFSDSYFRQINDSDSAINVLIGAKKFTEGWSSWRVSTMGLLSVGQSEGSEIIQLFGRGVRLKGINFSLKRSSETSASNLPKHIKKLETLNIFGIRANYMAQFSKFLEKEGVSANNEMVDIILPIHCNYDESLNLQTIRVKEGMDYQKKGPRPIVKAEVKISNVVLNWYPKIQAKESAGVAGDVKKEPNKESFNALHLAVLDINKIFFNMQDYKNERGWHNLNICRDSIKSLLLNEDWYHIEIPEESMNYSDNLTDDIARWQEIAEALMRKYMKRTYDRGCTKWEHKYLEYKVLEKNDGNFPQDKDTGNHQYVISVKADFEEDIRVKIKALGDRLKTWKLDGKGEFTLVESKLTAFWADKHLYQPLIYIDGKSEYIKIKPTALNEGENDFVVDLRTYIEGEPPLLKGKDIYLLRNQSRGVGVSFFENAEFYPDFILWIVDGDKQYISFIDPHGLRHTGIKNEKINLHKTIKDTQKELAKSDKNVTLNSFIVSTTPYSEFVKLWDEKIEDLAKLNIFFQDGANADYINRIIKKSLM